MHDVVNPATEEVVGSVPDNGVAEAEDTVQRAVAAAAEWARVSAKDRARLLSDFASAVDQELESLASLAVAEAGHPITAARWEASNVRDVLAYYSGAPERLLGAQIPAEGGLNVTFHEPFGGFKQSGLGRELGPTAAEEFTEVKTVFIASDG